jgi:hypothetical protein
MRAPHQLSLLPFDLIEVEVTRDELFHLRDGSWGSRRLKPDGEGWRIAQDYERRTIWHRRRPVIRRWS